MGEASRRRLRDRQSLRLQTLSQANEDIVQLPIQKPDEWYRGVREDDTNFIQDLYNAHGNGREFWVYRIDKFWIKESWKTPKGTLVHRGDLLLTITPNQEAKRAWLRLVKEYGDMFKAQIDVVENKRDAGCVSTWWMRRFIRSRQQDPKRPINHWQYFPIVEIYSPDGIQQSAVNTAEFESLGEIIDERTPDISPPTEYESRIFSQIIKLTVL